METNTLKNKALKGVFWKLLENFGTQGIAFIVTLVIARFIMPEDYGIIAIVTVFISIADVFVVGGFATALIQNKDVTDDDYSSVFILNFSVAVVLYGVIFLSAPMIAEFYNNPALSLVLRVLALKLLPGSLNAIQIAMLSKELQYNKLFARNIISGIPSGIIGIIMAYFGLGVWALVGQQLSAIVLSCIAFFFACKWRPRFVFKFDRIKILFSFGWKLLTSNLLNTLYNNIRTLIIGKLYNPATVGYYNKGHQIPNYLCISLDGAIQSVMFSTYSKVQDDKEMVKSIMRRTIKTSSYIIFPFMLGMAACASPFVSFALTDKWLPCVPFMQIFCFSYCLMPIHTANLQAINAMGRSDIFLKLEIIKKVIGVTVLLASVPFGVYPMAVSMAGVSVVNSFVNAYPNKKLLGYTYIEQIKDMIPNLIGALLMFGIVILLANINLPKILILIIQVLSGVVIYLLYSILTKSESFNYILDIIKSFLKKEGK